MITKTYEVGMKCHNKAGKFGLLVFVFVDIGATKKKEERFTHWNERMNYP